VKNLNDVLRNKSCAEMWQQVEHPVCEEVWGAVGSVLTGLVWGAVGETVKNQVGEVVIAEP
jgi:hypothetical protein